VTERHQSGKELFSIPLCYAAFLYIPRALMLMKTNLNLISLKASNYNLSHTFWFFPSSTLGAFRSQFNSSSSFSRARHKIFARLLSWIIFSYYEVLFAILNFWAFLKFSFFWTHYDFAEVCEGTWGGKKLCRKFN
jgi:hypothetical protein